MSGASSFGISGVGEHGSQHLFSGADIEAVCSGGGVEIVGGGDERDLRAKVESGLGQGKTLPTR